MMMWYSVTTTTGAGLLPGGALPYGSRLSGIPADRDA